MSITITHPKETETLNRRYWTREDYYRAGELGLFRADERLELIEGEIVTKLSPQGVPHASGIRRSAYSVEEAFSGVVCDVRTQLPLTFSNDTEPEPDIAVVRGTISDYERRHPSPEDVLLLIEVSDSTLAFDLGPKARVYAESAIPEYWVLDVRARKLVVRRDPVEGVYQQEMTLTESDTVPPLSAPNALIAVSNLFPNPPVAAGTNDTHA